MADKQEEQLEAAIVKLLEGSILDMVVKTLEEKARGLFIFGYLLDKQLQATKASGEIIDFAKLSNLPDGLGDMYTTSFRRMFPDKVVADSEWPHARRVIALIIQQAENLPEKLVEQVDPPLPS